MVWLCKADTYGIYVETIATLQKHALETVKHLIYMSFHNFNSVVLGVKQTLFIMRQI